MCFGGGSKTQYIKQPAPKTDVPSPPGREANQRFQQIRAGLAGGDEATVIDQPNAAKSATVIGG